MSFVIVHGAQARGSTTYRQKASRYFHLRRNQQDLLSAKKDV